MLPQSSRFRGLRASSGRDARPRPARRHGLVAAIALALSALASPAIAAAADAQHTVSKGQTLYAIARRYRTTVDAIREANGLRRGQRIHPGLVLVIPDRGKASGRDGGKAAARPSPGKAASAREPARGATQAASLKKGARPERDDGAASAKRFARRPKRPGWVRLVRGAEQLELQLLTRNGRLVPKSLPKLSRIMRASPTASIPIDPRLATLIGMVSNHFGGRTIRIVSGYRPYSPTQYTPHSNHNFGRAIDFLVEGVPNTVVRDLCRGFRNVGVGYYPNSTFVHLDVRSAKVYWVDYSRPGEAPRYDPSKGSIAADEAARDVPGAAEEEVYGSWNTPVPNSQPVENQGGNQRTPGPAQKRGESMGADSPTQDSKPTSETR